MVAGYIENNLVKLRIEAVFSQKEKNMPWLDIYIRGYWFSFGYRYRSSSRFPVWRWKRCSNRPIQRPEVSCRTNKSLIATSS